MTKANRRVFDPELLLRTLAVHDVKFVLIGGWAAKLQGSPSVTADIDICYARDRDNLERLSGALQGLDIRLRGIDDDVPFSLDLRTLQAGDAFTLSSSAGDIDLIGSPAGVAGFGSLEAGADTLELDGLSVRVASIDDLISMKSATGRPKDMIEVQILEALRQEIQRAQAD